MGTSGGRERRRAHVDADHAVAQTSGRMIPRTVATAAVEFALAFAGEPEEEVELFPFFFSSMSATNRAKHRIPLPHISGSDPSLL